MKSLMLYALALAVAAGPGSTMFLAAAMGQEEALAGEAHVLARLRLNAAPVVDACRLVSEISRLNVVATQAAGERTVTLFLQDVTAVQAMEALCKVAGLWYRRDPSTRSLRVMTTEEYQRDHSVYREEEIRVFTLDFPNAISVAVAIEDLFGDRVSLSLGVDDAELDPTGVSGFGGAGLGGAGVFGAAGGTPFGGGFQDGLGGRRSASAFGGAGGGLFRSSRSGGLYSRGISQSGQRYQGRAGVSDRLVEESLTPEQISRLEQARGAEGPAREEILRGIIRTEPTIFVTVNQQHNLIAIRTVDKDVMGRIAALVKDLDRATPQVLLEMQILELRVDDSFRSVFDFDVFTGGTTAGPPTSQPVNPLLPSAVTGPASVLGSGNFPLEGGTLVYQFVNNKVRARIQLLQREGRAAVVASPLVLASNNRVARIFIGEERVLTTGVSTDVITPGTGAATALIEPTTEVRDVGTTLVLLPKINADRTVTLFIAQDNSSVSPNSANIPIVGSTGSVTAFPIDTVRTASVQVTVVARDRMTLAIGGLLQTEHGETEEKVPVLGDIPLLGALFRRTEKTAVKSEIMLLITPRVLLTPAEAEEASRKVIEKSVHPFHRGESGLPPGREGR